MIKNIPFNVKRETLLDIIVRGFYVDARDRSYTLSNRLHSIYLPHTLLITTWISLVLSAGWPLLIFVPQRDADAVVAALNGFDVQGRKLRVEYKKVLQAGEKERIEREKALRRMRSMQLERDGRSQQPFEEFTSTGGTYVLATAEHGCFRSAEYSLSFTSSSFSHSTCPPTFYSNCITATYTTCRRQASVKHGTRYERRSDFGDIFTGPPFQG